MPAYLTGARTDTYYVQIGTAISYAWTSRDLSGLADIAQADLTALDIRPTPAAGTVVIFRASAPRPPRYTKKIGTVPTPSARNSASTFGSPLAGAAARALGWRQSKPGRLASFGDTGKSIIAVAKIDQTLSYASPMNKTDFTAVAATLGLATGVTENTIAERQKVIRGVSSPRPAKVAKAREDGGTITSFCSYDKLAAAIQLGWNEVSPASEVVLS